MAKKLQIDAEFGNFLVGILVCVALAFAFVYHGSGDSMAQMPAEGTINPNFAGLGLLMQLPGIGFKKACAIVDYRRRMVAESGGCIAFRDYADMTKVKGIGPKTAENIQQWLRFEDSGVSDGAVGNQ